MNKLFALSCLCLCAVACGDGAGYSTLSIPFAVDDAFVASGYFGDGMTPGLFMDNGCTVRATAMGIGKCHSFTWTTGVSGTLNFAGLYWQYPANNAGAMTGQIVPAGAQSISFYAWGSKGGETATFFAGIKGVDNFYVENGPLTLTTTPTQHWLSLTNATYVTATHTDVVGGFGFDTGDYQFGSQVIINVDEIQWSLMPAGESIPGCTNSAAYNFNAGATTDDGSCTFPVTFQVDLTGVTMPSPFKPQIRSSFNGYCADCNLLAQNPGTNVWTSTLPLAPGVIAYKYALNDTQAGFEVVPKACSTDMSQSDADRTRALTVTAAAQTIPLVNFSSCTHQ